MILLTIELALRLIYPDKIESSTPKVPVFKYNKDYLIALKPNLKTNFVRRELNGGDTIRWSTNSEGFRGGPLRENHDKRIIVYGDSNILGRFSELEQTFSKRLEAYLSDSTELNMEVVNAGIDGFGPDQNLLRIKKEVEKYKPDVIVLHIFADNDFGDIVRNKLFMVDNDDNLVNTNIPRDTILQEPGLGPLSSLLIVKAATRISQMVFKRDEEWYVKSYNKWIRDEYLAFRGEKDIQYSVFGDHYDLDVATDTSLPSSKLKAGLLNAIIKETRQFLSEKDIELLVLIQPSIVDLTLREDDLDYQYLETNFADYHKTNLTKVVEDICVENQVDYINLFEPFASNNPESLYFQFYDNHWSDLGQDLAAKITASHIIKTNQDR